MFISFSAATIAELIALSFYYPFDLIKTRMQTSNEKYQYRSVIDAFMKIYEQEALAKG